MVSDPPAAGDVLRLFESLPGEAPSRGVASEGSKSWTTGAYAQGSFRGLRTNTVKYFYTLACPFSFVHNNAYATVLQYLRHSALQGRFAE